MPEKVTRQEKIIELAILKARETIEALRDGEKIEPYDMEKVKRPKAQSYKTDYKQDPDHANAGPKKEGFTSRKIKKASNKMSMITAVRSARAFVLEGDRKIERQLAKGVLNEEETKALKQLKTQVEAVYQSLTTQMNMLSRGKSSLGDFKKDDRDVEFTEEQQQMADETFAAIEAAMKKITSEYLTSPLDKQGKMESDMKEITDDLDKLKDYFGRSS